MLLSEWSQSEKASYCINPTIWYYGKGKTMVTVKRSVVVRDREVEWWISGTHRNFRGVKIDNTIMINVSNYIFVQTMDHKHQQ